MNRQTPITQHENSGGVPVTTTTCANMMKNAVTKDTSEGKMGLLTPSSANAPIRRVIRKITPIDAKKLQQYGLHRTIAEAVNKYKLSAASSNKQRSSKIIQLLPSSYTVATSPGIIKTSTSQTITPPSKTVTSPIITASSTPVASSSKIISAPNVVNAQLQQQNAAKTSLLSKSMTPPKITITGPEASTEIELKKLEGLNSQQRLMHVKNLLNKKLSEKNTSTNDVNAKAYKQLKPPSDTSALQDQNNVQVNRKELLTIADKAVTNSKVFVALKDTAVITPAKSNKVSKAITPQKSPKDIARKLDFKGETETETERVTKSVQHQSQRSYKKSLNSEICNIPKASLKNSNSQEQQIKQTNYSVKIKEIKPTEKHKIDFPEMSPLKIHFPTTNLPKETPLPNIDCFKKPYTLSNAAAYNAHIQMKDSTQADYGTNNYITYPVSQQPSVLGDNASIHIPACSSTSEFENSIDCNSTNCLIVLENKVLSQDEMIDLTELRLSTSKVDKPRFTIPHKPIPEVVIKEENSDEYPTILPPLQTEEITQTNIPIETNVTTSVASTDRVVISTKQNKKIIINAQKLKLPPDQLANLAKQIAQRSGVSKTNITPSIQQSKLHENTIIGSNLVNNNNIINTNSDNNYGHLIDNANNSTTNSCPVHNSNNQMHADPSKNNQLFQYSHNFKPKLNSKQFIIDLPAEHNQDAKTVQTVQLTHNKPNQNKVDNPKNNKQQFIIIVKEEPKSNDGFNTLQNQDKQYLNNLKDQTTVKPNKSSICYRKPAVEIIDEPVDANDSFSAVDFIASLRETNPITEETSFELSPEELNLNASFAMSFSPLRINSYKSGKTQDREESILKTCSSLSPKIDNLVNVTEQCYTTVNSQQMSTIVIESSKGPETILTNENNAIKMYNTLQNTPAMNTLNKIGMKTETETEKSKNLPDCNSKQSETIEQLTQSSIKEVENTNNICNDSQIDIDATPSQSSNLPISNDLALQQKNIGSSTSKEHKEFVAEEKLINYSTKKCLAENLNSSVQDSEKSAKKIAEISSTYASVKQSSNEVLVTDTKGIAEESKATNSKTNESNSVALVATKRISRFKKGKINLVQRNKTTPGANKMLAAKTNDTKSNNMDKCISSAANAGETNNINTNEESNDKLSKNNADEPSNIIEETHQTKYKKDSKDISKPYKSSEIIQNTATTESMPNKQKENINDELSKTDTNNKSTNISSETTNNAESKKSPNNSSESKKDGANSGAGRDIVNLLEYKKLEQFINENVDKHNQEKCSKVAASIDLPTSTTESIKTNLPENISMQNVVKENCINTTDQKPTTYNNSTDNNKIEETLKSNTNTENISCKNVTQLLEPNILSVVEEETLRSKNLLEDVKQSKVSLIDIVNNSPPKVLEKPPIIPFKKNTTDTTCHKPIEYKGIKNLLKQLKAHEKDDQKEKEKEKTGEFPKIVNVNSQDVSNMSTAKDARSSQLQESVSPVTSTENTQKDTTSLAVSVNSKDQLTSDEQLEFLSVSAEIKPFELNKSSENVSTPSNDTPLITTKSSAFLGLTPSVKSHTLTRRTRLYSNPLGNELTNVSLPTLKRTRFYSQTFDSLKTTCALKKISNFTPKKCLTTEESCLEEDSTNDRKSPFLSRQRKKLRKTLEDIKKSQKTNSDSDTEDDNRDFTCTNDCEESNEFLGFEEDTLNVVKNSEIPNKQKVENITLHKAKGGNLKNWLTTGKAISPTLTNETHNKRTTLSPATRSSVPLKKRIDLSAKLHEETDITDDTSPADDEEESNAIGKSDKLSSPHDKNLLVSKKIKLEKSLVKEREHIFSKPQQLRTKSKSSCTDSDCNDGKKTPDRLNSNHSKDISEHKREESETKLIPANETSKSETGSDCHEIKISKRLKSKQTDSDTEISGVDSNCNVDKRKSKQSKPKLNKTKNANKDQCSTEIVVEKESIQKQKKSSIGFLGNSTIANNNDTKPSDYSELQENKKLSLDKSLNSKNSDLETSCHKDKKSKKRKSKEHKEVTEIQSLDAEATDKSLPYLNKNFKRKKKNILETEITPASKKVKLSGKEKLKSPNLQENSNDSKTSPLLMPLEVQPRSDLKKKLPPKRKLKIEDSNSEDNAEKIVKKETPKAPPKRGKKQSTICNFNPRLLLVTKAEQLNTDEVLTESEPGQGPIQCGLCLERTYPPNWPLHLAKHYGIGWKVGEEKLNIENRSAVLNYIIAYLKGKGSDTLNCRMCNKTYRSGVGLLMHIESCGVQAKRLICEFCKRDYALSSLPIHLRSCHVRFMLENKNKRKEEESFKENEEVFGNTGRLKRRSTIKAENKLKDIEKELGNVLSSDKSSQFEAKDRIKYVPPLLEKDCKQIWLNEIQSNGKGSCPKKSCKFTSKDLKELTNHLSVCKYIKSGYVCKPCRKRIFKTEKEAIDHVIKTHQNTNESDYEVKSNHDEPSSEEISTDENDASADDASAEENDEPADEEGEVVDVGSTKNKRKHMKPYIRTANLAFQRKRVYNIRSVDLNDEVLKKWNYFLKQNYNTEPIFTEFRTEFSVEDNQNFLKYLPSNTKSMKFNISKKAILRPSLGEPDSNIEWSELNRFESINNKKETLYYLGAPIKFCSWLPLPNDVDEQYLMVCYRRDKYTKFLNPKQHCTVLLIFKVMQNNHIPELKIHYGFIVKDGPVHNVAFLPSGGYDESTNRLGLVAVATINSIINIYALPINVENASTAAKETDSIEQLTFIDIKPQFSLRLDINTKETDHTLLKSQCLQICWSEFSGHKHIFASFSNGFIGIWDVTNDSEDNLNRYVVDDFINFVPLNYFYLGEKGIKSMALHYDTQGPRWLAVAGFSRKFVIYDIKNLTQPLIMKDEFTRNIILSMDWCQVWETVLNSYCDSMPNNGRCISVVNPTNIMFNQNKLDVMPAGVTQVHYSPLNNICVASVENGDLVFLNPRELYYEYQLGKHFGGRRIFSATDIQQLNGEEIFKLPKTDNKNLDSQIPSNWSMYDEHIKDKYGLIFKPFLKLEDNMKQNYLNEKRCPPLNIIPLLRINALRCNLNLNAKNLVALGYENGFLRIIYFNRDKHFNN